MRTADLNIEIFGVDGKRLMQMYLFFVRSL